MKQLIGLLIAVVLPAVVQAQFTYKTSKGDVTITRYTGTGGAVTIPGTIKGLPVTVIGTQAFYATRVSEVFIPDSVISIGNDAFSNCGSLTNVTVGSEVTSIGDSAFVFCTKLKRVSCRGNAPSLGGPNVFRNTLATVFYLSGTTGWGKTLDGRPTVLWNPPVPYIYTTNNSTITILSYTGSGGVVIIPDSINFLPVTSVVQGFFANFVITSVTIPNGVTNIGNNAFAECTSLTNITIPNSVINIGNNAFSGCSSLTSVAIPGSVISIDDYAFSECTNLTSITISNGVTSIGFEELYNCTSLTNVTIPNSITNIGSYAFYNCASLTSVTIPSGVNAIEDGVFIFCHGLTNITIPSSVLSIGTFAFGYTSLTSLTIPNTVTNIGSEAFFNCDNLVSVNINKSVTDIGGGAYGKCASLSAISVDASNSFFSSVDGVLFNHNQTLLVQFPAGKAGSSYTIPNNVTNIDELAFSGCTRLISITIPNSVTSIGDSAFYYCTNLQEVFFNGNAPNIVGYDIFDSTFATIYYLPSTTGWDTTFAGFPTALWLPQAQTTGANFALQNNQFGFNINWASGQTVVVEASTNLANPIWQPVQTNTLTDGSSYFSDPQWTNYPTRFYRLRSP